MKIVATLAVLCMTSLAVAADKPCTKADATHAQRTLDRTSTWPQMHKAWQDFGHCDSDATGDQFADALMRLIIDWKNVDAFSGLVRKDPKFKSFVFAQLQRPAAKDDLEDVYARAKSKCPAGQDAFCAELADVARPKK